MGRSVLGLKYDSSNDLLAIEFKVNVGPVKRGIKLEADLTLDTLYIELPRTKLPPRLILRIVNSQYDPLGLVSPITIRLKKAHQKMHIPEKKLTWDDEIQLELREQWVELIEMLVVARKIEFHRSTRPVGAVGDPELILFWDGSNDGKAAVVYIRWTKEDDAG